MESDELKRRKIVLKKNSPQTNTTDDFLIEINNHEHETTCLNNGENFNKKAISLDETHLLLEKKLREKLIEAQRNLNEIEQQQPKEKCDLVLTSRKEDHVSLEKRHNNNLAKLDDKKKGKSLFFILSSY